MNTDYIFDDASHIFYFYFWCVLGYVWHSDAYPAWHSMLEMTFNGHINCAFLSIYLFFFLVIKHLPTRHWFNSDTVFFKETHRNEF